MNFKWFQIFNFDEFNDSGLVSRTYNLTLVGLGDKEILVTRGDTTSMLFENTFLTLELHSKNPFIFNNYAIYRDGNEDVWLGVPV